jgi:EAL domain-containing protein (putative c-di-GMP-specific phosphodiesterase class I)
VRIALFGGTFDPPHVGHLLRIQQDTSLQSALKNEEFKLYYQPIVATESKELIAYESLIRWLRPATQLLLPGKFIASLERLGLMREVGQFVLRRAIQQHAEWLRNGVSPISVSVNVSASQFADAGFAKLIKSLLGQYALDPALLCLELTEDLLINNSAQTRRIFAELSELGVKFSIDDFGTGHNSYSYLKNFPISTIKIDRSFTRLLHVDRIDRAIARSQINLARELGMQVIAEGVENHIVLGALEELQPDGLQGFLIGRPMPVARFERTFLKNASFGIARAASA